MIYLSIIFKREIILIKNLRFFCLCTHKKKTLIFYNFYFDYLLIKINFNTYFFKIKKKLNLMFLYQLQVYLYFWDQFYTFPSNYTQLLNKIYNIFFNL